MKRIITNVNNLNEDEITDFTTKVKFLLINSKSELLLAYANNRYQFIGGTQEYGESLIDTANRELKEETGIELDISSIEPFAVAIGYYKDWPELGRNKKVEIYYYEIKMAQEPDIDKMELTEDEKAANFELRYVSLDNMDDVLDKNILEYGDNSGIAKEMKKVLDIYRSNKKIRR